MIKILYYTFFTILFLVGLAMFNYGILYSNVVFGYAGFINGIIGGGAIGLKRIEDGY